MFLIVLSNKSAPGCQRLIHLSVKGIRVKNYVMMQMAQLNLFTSLPKTLDREFILKLEYIFYYCIGAWFLKNCIGPVTASPRIPE
jgi:hypothetical protein